MTDMKIVDTSFDAGRQSCRVTRTAHLVVHRSGRPDRETIVQAEVILGAQGRNSCAQVSVLSDVYTWTALLEPSTHEVVQGTCSPREPIQVIERSLEAFADSLLQRAATILGS